MQQSMQLYRMPAGNWLDRAIAVFAPAWAASRIQARARLDAVRHYEAAQSSRRTAGWHRSATDANAAASPARTSLREISRDMRRNNAWFRRAIGVISNNAVGWGIRAKAKGMTRGKLASANEVWTAWSETTACDYDGRLAFAGIQRLVMETIVESGEALIMRERALPADGLPVPIRLRVLEPDYLSSGNDVVRQDGSRISDGIEYDASGRRVAYWMYRSHPGSRFSISGSSIASDVVRVPASDVIHIYRVERPGQMRGVPWMAAAISRLKDLDDYEDAVLMQAKIAACFGAFVTDLDGGAPAIGEPDADDDRLETLEPGHIEYLRPGQQVTVASPPKNDGNKSFVDGQLRAVCASMGITYEDLTFDYSNVNYSSARMARLAHWACIHDTQWHMLIPVLCDRVWSWVMTTASGLYGWGSVPGVEWTPPPMPVLDPAAEGDAASSMIRSGMTTLYRVIREQGYDPEEHLAEIAEGNRALDALGIVLDSDARYSSGGTKISLDTQES